MAIRTWAKSRLVHLGMRILNTRQLQPLPNSLVGLLRYIGCEQSSDCACNPLTAKSRCQPFARPGAGPPETYVSESPLLRWPPYEGANWIVAGRRMSRAGCGQLEKTKNRLVERGVNQTHFCCRMKLVKQQPTKPNATPL